MTTRYEYIDFNGENIEVECLDWLEDGTYYDETEEEELPCSRYYIGEIDGDSESVWLNDDMQEVDA